MDVLSEVLRVVRLSGTIHFRAEFTHPWAILSSPPVLLAARLQASEGSVTPFHVVTEGSCLVISGDLAPIQIESGDVIVFPRGDQHVMTSDPELKPVPIQDIYSQPSKEQITVVNHGGGGPAARFICGFLHSDQRFDPLLKSLPAILCIRSRGETLTLETLDRTGRNLQTITHPPEKAWWRASVSYLMSETAAPGPGNRAVLARLAKSLFLELLRWQLQFATQGHRRRMAGGAARSPGRSGTNSASCAARQAMDSRSACKGSRSFACGARKTLCRTGRRVADPVSRGLADAFGPAPAARQYPWRGRDRWTRWI